MVEIQTNAAIFNSYATAKTEKMKSDENTALLLQVAAKLASEDSAPLMTAIDEQKLHIKKCTNEQCLRSCLLKLSDASGYMKNHATLLMLFYYNHDELMDPNVNALGHAMRGGK